jgi:hypothetical protein
VSTYNPPPECAPWFRRLEDKLRRAYSLLTCSRVADVVPRQPAQRPPRHSTRTPDPQVSPSQQYTHRHDPRPRFTPPQPRSTRPQFEVGSSSHQPEHFEPGPSQPVPSQPGTSSWVMPPHMMMQQPGMHQWGMPRDQGFGQPSYAEMIWSGIAPPMTQPMLHLG